MMEVTPAKFWGIGSFARDANPEVNMLHGKQCPGVDHYGSSDAPVWAIQLNICIICTNVIVTHPFYKGIAYVLGLL